MRAIVFLGIFLTSCNPATIFMAEEVAEAGLEEAIKLESNNQTPPINQVKK